MHIASNPPKKFRFMAVDSLRIIIFLVFGSTIDISYCSAYSDIVYSGGSYDYEVKSLDGEIFTGPNYIFFWMCSDGFPDSYRQNTFKWTAPVVHEPKNVTITAFDNNGNIIDSKEQYFIFMMK